MNHACQPTLFLSLNYIPTPSFRPVSTRSTWPPLYTKPFNSHSRLMFGWRTFETPLSQKIGPAIQASNFIAERPSKGITQGSDLLQLQLFKFGSLQVTLHIRGQNELWVTQSDHNSGLGRCECVNLGLRLLSVIGAGGAKTSDEPEYRFEE